MVTKAELIKKDLAHVIHPFGVMGVEPKFIWDRGEGAYVQDIDGNRYLDLTSGGVHICSLGHSPKEIIDAVSEQMQKFAYFSAGAPNAATEQYIEYCAELAEVLPGDINHVYMTVCGSESTEVATQIARHYWDSVGQPEKYKIIALNRAYHGGTLLSRSLTGSQVGMGSFGRRTPEVVRIPNYHVRRTPIPYGSPFTSGEDSANYLEWVIEQEGEDTISCMIAEVALGNGGVIWPPDDWWPITRKICSEHNILLIADEVQTGFCRSGKFWGLDHYNVVPDILDMGKAINSGFLPCGAVGVSDKIVDAFPKGQPFKGYVTQDANALVVASARAALKAYKAGMADRVAKLGAHLTERLNNEFQPLPVVDYISGKGLYQSFSIELGKTTGKPYDPVATAKARDFLAAKALEKGVLLGTCDGYPRREPIVPPFVITEEELDKALDVTLSVLKQIKPV